MSKASNEYMTAYIRRRYIKLKLRAIAYKGGKCKKCGYDRCPAALGFHHRDPSTKLMDWKTMRKRSWTFITSELDKCDMLCANCHAEEHYDPEITEEAMAHLATIARSEPVKLQANCDTCGKPITSRFQRKTSRYCSIKCCCEANEKIKWPEPQALLQMTRELGQVQVGLKLGVSNRSVKKRLNKFGLII